MLNKHTHRIAPLLQKYYYPYAFLIVTILDIQMIHIKKKFLSIKIIDGFEIHKEVFKLINWRAVLKILCLSFTLIFNEICTKYLPKINFIFRKLWNKLFYFVEAFSAWDQKKELKNKFILTTSERHFTFATLQFYFPSC